MTPRAGQRVRVPEAPSEAPEAATLSDDEFSAAVEAISSAFGDGTRRQIYLFAREGAGVTAGEVAHRFALHPNVARHHLDKLAAGGYLEVHLDHALVGAGRPSKRYRVSAQRATLAIPPQRDQLLAMLLTRALALLEVGQAEAMAERVGEEYGRSLAEQMAPGDSQRSVRAAMHAVADALTAHGFAARAEAREDMLTAIVQDSCPFGSVASQHPVLCAVDRGIVVGLLAGLCGDDEIYRGLLRRQ